MDAETIEVEIETIEIEAANGGLLSGIEERGGGFIPASGAWGIPATDIPACIKGARPEPLWHTEREKLPIISRIMDRCNTLSSVDLLSIFCRSIARYSLHHTSRCAEERYEATSIAIDVAVCASGRACPLYAKFHTEWPYQRLKWPIVSARVR
ncbi:MAG: hypothetical protein K0R57_5539 [Paenibacillaceae bacterium]|jgi:hypothetical protein|nr:hypothetical protein [Paenibacillaceae bacterium]